MAFYQATLAATLALTLAGCVAPAKTTTGVAPACATGAAMTQTTLYFGLSRPAGADITADEWHNFVDKEVTPRFREGLSIFDARGQWLGNDGKLAREQSKALMLIHGADAASNGNIEALRGIYKSRFMQDSVMRVDRAVCVAF